MGWHSRKMWTQFLTVIIGLKAVFENCPQLTIHCSYYSMATIYAIENNIPFEQIGTYTDSAETVLDRSDTSYY